MPYYRDKLLSAWGNDRVFEARKPPPVADSDFPNLSRRGPANIGLIALNPRKYLRNQVDRPLTPDTNGHALTEPKYLSDKARIFASDHEGSEDVNEITAAFASFALTGDAGDAPHGYEELRIKYGGPRGVQDFDFG